jgi:hypothetical protein
MRARGRFTAAVRAGLFYRRVSSASQHSPKAKDHGDQPKIDHQRYRWSEYDLHIKILFV